MKNTITYKGIEFEVEYFFQPYEPQEEYYPGSPAVVELENIYFKGVSFLELLDEDIEDIEDLIMEEYH